MLLMIEVASDSDLTGVMQTAMSGSPTDLLKAKWYIPKSGIFFETAVEYQGVHKSLWLGCDSWIHQRRRALMDTSGMGHICFRIGRESARFNGYVGSNKSLSQVVEDDLDATMKPELPNRLDEIVVLSPLSSNDSTSIASLLPQQTGKWEQTGRHVKLEL